MVTSTHSSDGATQKVKSSTVSPPIYSLLSVTASHNPQSVHRLMIVKKGSTMTGAFCVGKFQGDDVVDDVRNGGRLRPYTRLSKSRCLMNEPGVGHVVDDVRNWETTAPHTTQQESVFDD